MSQPQRVVLYRRVSALMGRGGDDFHSPEMQTAAMRKHVAPLGMRVVAEVEDLDVSGRTFNREGLAQVREMVKARMVDAVAVYDLSRLGRNVAESLTFIQFLREHRVGVISTVERIDDSPEGQFMLTQFLALAQLFSDQIGRRWKEVHLRVAQQGRHHGPTPIGYKRGASGLEIDPELGPAVRQAIEDYAAGRPVTHIARELGTARGKPIGRSGVKRIVENPIYLGKVSLWGSTDRVRKWAAQPRIVTDDAHPALTDEATYRKCIERCARDSVMPPRSRQPKHALAGRVRCGPCGGSAVLWRSNSEVRYRCARRTDTREPCAGFGTPTVAQVEEELLAAMASYVSGLKGPVGATAARLVRQRQPGEDLAALDEKLSAVQEEMNRLTTGWAQGRVPERAYEAALADAQRRAEALEERRRKALAAPRPLVDAGQLVSIADELLELWPGMEPWERNEGVRRLGFRATLWPRSAAERVTFDIS